VESLLASLGLVFVAELGDKTQLGARLPERVTQLGSAALFALFGAVLLVANV
jgi:putative Ca2+/H+ antiporter (TMEM165/GDT1 family)